MTVDKQPRALYLADVLDAGFEWHQEWYEIESAKELRRLHAENEDYGATIDHLARENAEQIGEIVALKEQRDELLEALRMNAQTLAWLAHGKCRGFHPGLPAADKSLDAARAAIAKATGEME